MARRPLDADEAALWARVLQNVRPLAGRAPPPVFDPPPASTRAPVSPAKPDTPPVSRPVATPSVQTATLDASWDKRLARGQIAPDSVVDLHGDTLQHAYLRLDGALEQAIADGDRVMLLVTGRPPRGDSDRPHARGAIRGAVGDWLAHSRHSRSIAAVRGAHPRHGGNGALYIVIRRQRTAPVAPS